MKKFNKVIALVLAVLFVAASFAACSSNSGKDRRVENEFGKTEMWYVLDAAPGAQLIYGFKEKISKEAFKAAIENNTLPQVLNHVDIHKGDVFFIEAGTVHAIGKGALIAEIQQNSNVTYRVYDYDRRGADGKPRELHVAKALDVQQRKG